MSKQHVYSFGYNAFQQTSEKNQETAVREPACHANVKSILLVSWESSIVLNEKGHVDIWGYKPIWFDKLKTICDNKHINSFFGDPERLLGIIDEKEQVSFVSSTGEEYRDWTEAKLVVYCKEQDALFCLKKDGSVQQYYLKTDLWKSVRLPTAVITLSASPSHVLFFTESYTPVYALGSNRFSQLGIGSHQQKVDHPVMLEFFCGLANGATGSCGLFHSAVVLGGDVYTFGWLKDGRLGWGDEDTNNDNIISLGIFLDADDQSVFINAVKVACGAAHTLVLDDKGLVWSCGSNKYGQLGRPIKGEYDPFFRRCTLFDIHGEKAVDCFAGHWNSFIITRL